ncbi:hypothetical protein OEZ85_009052 [Tetradesmus obliquus]|uniref:Uncharacterized protein n=1 Tax=Tetradesmus obliquus TaxID=3088 RepID=A0ABY8TMW2_TETOB|nr:hypothetical protein OEZ85_009052 [Tetradesmus obliquus]
MAPRQPADPVVAAYRKMFQVKLTKQEIKDDLAAMQRELKAMRQASSSSDGSRGAPRYEAYPYQQNQMEL